MTIDDLGNLGDAISGLVAVVLGIVALLGSRSAWADWRARQQAEKELAEEQTKELRLNRERTMRGWMPGGTQVYGVQLVTEPAELSQALDELKDGRPSDYVLLRVSESEAGNVNRAYSLRQMVMSQGYVAQAPSTAEYEALQRGRELTSGK
ncbi:hypothetical protein [Micromonospora sediminimaris]|uniref:Uncharacterized protein n=1 Tax=Micromonospora sediminimaris TaxID=547162 RepID=A0A9W5UTT9_9ACTN|nr:hypothetical protein [Micromonospora sediminimaris]GIJ34992.1 hypothetical protein Vse01_41400 [Micromonospora sediminimaris]